MTTTRSSAPSGNGRALPTDPEPVGTATVRHARTVRRIFVVLLVAFLVLGASSLLGVRSRTVIEHAGGYELRVTYPQVTRAGLAVPFATTVVRDGGFDGPITLELDLRYLDLFDENAINPEPASSTSDGARLALEFEPVEGATEFEVRFDTRTGPNVQWGRRGSTTLVVEGTAIASVRYRTWVMP